MKILLIGVNGQLGFEINACLKENSQHELVTLSRDQFDLLNHDKMREQILKIQPDLLINTAAYTAVDLAQSEPDQAMAINSDAMQCIAKACQSINAWVIHFSTDYVFNGEKTTPYLESDECHPLNEYGKSKRMGEQHLLNECSKALIFRISWVYSWRAKNFVLTMLKLAEQRNQLSIVGDQVGNPSYAPDIAQMMMQVIDTIDQSDPDDASISGIYHLPGGSTTTWAGFASSIFELSAKNVLVNAIASCDYPTPATRPLYSVMDDAKVRAQFGSSLPSFEDALPRCLNKINDSSQ